MRSKIKNMKRFNAWSSHNTLRISPTGNITNLAQADLELIRDYALTLTDLRVVVFEFATACEIDESGARQLVAVAHELNSRGIKTIFHAMTSTHRHYIDAATGDSAKAPYLITITEYQVKDLMEACGVKYCATEVLKHGITKYTSTYARENQLLLNTLAKGQKPHTLLITCSDSRIFFSANIGEIFVVRNVGNVVPPYMPDNIYSEIAAIEYAVYELGVRNIVICGHTECGAVKAAYTTGEDDLGYVGLDNWLSLIKTGFKQKKPTDIANGVEINLLNQVENLKTYPTIVDMIKNNQITVNAWIYDVHSGNIQEWDESQRQFNQID